MEEIVMKALCSHHSNERIQGAMQLSSLTSKQKHKLVETGIFHPLLAMLNSQELGMTEAAMHALLSLTYGSERNKIKIVKYGAVPILLMILQYQPSITLNELAITTLLILSSCTRNKLAIASSGAIPILIDNLGREQHDISYQAKLDSIATLLNLWFCDEIIPTLVSSNLLIYLLNTIHNSEKSSCLVEKAITLLEKIVTSSEIALHRTATMNGAIPTLVETIEEGSPQCKELAVGILLHICQDSRDKYRGLMLREGVMTGLLQLSVEGTVRTRNLAQSLLFLLRDVSGKGSIANQVKYEVLEHIMERIDEDEDGFSTASLNLVEQMIARLSA